jgi:hypothetical protein
MIPKKVLISQEVTTINNSTWVLLVGSNLSAHEFRIYENTGVDIQVSHSATGAKPRTIPAGSQYQASLAIPLVSPHGDGTGIYAKTVSASAGLVEFESTKTFV